MDVKDLIGRLCVMAGMIMEDATVGAISDGADQREQVADLDRASEVIRALASAAQLLEAYTDTSR